MKVSLNWIRSINEKYGCAADPASGGIDSLIANIGAQLGAVEEVINVGEKYKDIVIAKIVKCQKHPNADKLSICLINDGKKIEGVKRNKQGLVQVVHGAKNVRTGQLVAWIPPGVIVPSTFDKDPFILETKNLRGEISNGMIASAQELALSDDHENILIINEPARPGQALAEVYDLNDHIIDIENKMFTHRPDCFGMLGVAREIAGIQHHRFKSPSWYREDAAVPTSRARDDHRLTVKNEVPRLARRFCAIVIKDVKVGPSPLWLQVRLSSTGVRPINNIVDLTNFFMLETAQPLHAYDYDKVKTGTLGIRLSRKGEKLRLLGGKSIKLEAGAVVITDGSKPIGLGGVMGGADTEVDGNTKNIILECANFDMSITRKTAMEYGLFTDAATRFTKNQSPRQTQTVIAKAANDILGLAGGRVSGKLIDDKHFVAKDTTVIVTRDFINSRLGLSLPANEMRKLLQNTEFKVSLSGEKLTVIAPFWRTDIKIPEDIVEEVGRLYGYEHLPLQLPPRDLTPAKLDPLLAFKSQLRHILSSAGANEVLTYSFVNNTLLANANQEAEDAYHIRNALSPDLQYYRLSLTPSLLEKVHSNVKARFDRFALFEIGAAHVRGVEDSEKLPAELLRLGIAIVSTSKPKEGKAAFYKAKYYVDNLLNKLSISDVEYWPLEEAKNQTKDWQAASKAFELKRSAALYGGKNFLGVVGEPSAKLRAALKLPLDSAAAELNINAMQQLSAAGVDYRPLNRFPSLDQDLCLRSSIEITYAGLTEFLKNHLGRATKEHGYGFAVEPLDIFQRPKDKSHKQTTWRISFWHPQRTLTTTEVNRLFDKIAVAAKKELAAERI